LGENFKDFYESDQRLLREIELAYITSRYFSIEYTEEDIRDMLKLANKFKKLIG